MSALDNLLNPPLLKGTSKASLIKWKLTEMHKNCNCICAILLVLFLFSFTYAQDVYWEPENPIQGGQVTIYYNLEARNILPIATNPCYIHLGYNGWTNTVDYVMEKTVDGLWKYDYVIPNNATIIDFVFTDLQNSWDNNGGIGVDWYINVYSEGLSVVVVSPEVENPYGDPFCSPVFVSQNEVIPIVITTVTDGIDVDSLFLFVDNTEVSKTNNDSLKYDFDTFIYTANEYEIQCIGKDINSISDTAKFAIVVRPDQVSQFPLVGIKYGISIKSGINYIDNTTVTLALFAPYKEFVYVIGDFNDWKVDNDFIMNMYRPDADSTLWWITLDNLTPGTEYSFQYLIDGEIRIADPYTDKILDPWNDNNIPFSTYPNLKSYPNNKTDHAVSVFQTDQLEYQWQNNDDFIRPEKKDLVIYELLIRDFIEEHDYSAVMTKLDYLEKLGINAIELMPINEFEGNSSWGYNPSFYFAPDKYYGTKKDLKAFVDECHRRGIAVIQDIVLNHSYGQSPLVRLYWDDVNNRPAANNPWYNVQSPNSVYSWGYDFNHESMHTNSFFDRVLRYWIEEYKIDGFRLDFTKGLTNKTGEGTSYDVSRIAILERIADEVWSYDSTSYLILEHFADNYEEEELADYGFMLWGNSNHNYNQATMGYYNESDFSGGYYKSRGWTEPNLVTYMESHDEERLMYKNLLYGNSSGNYDIKNLATALDRQKLAAAFFFTLPGPKMIWQFGELGYDFSINYNGRVGEKPIRWDYFNDSDRKELYDMYSRLINIRNKNEVFRSPETNVELSLNNSNGLKRIGLSHFSMSVIIIGNFGVNTQSIDPNFFYSAIWYDDFNGVEIDVTDIHAEIELVPGEFRIFNNKHLLAVENENDGDSRMPLSFLLSQNYPNPFNPITTIKYTVPSEEIESAKSLKLKIYNILGNEIATLVDEIKPPGEYSVQFNIGTGFKPVPTSGIYFYTLSIGDKTLTKKMLLLK